MKVSIITATYNSSETICDTLNSLHQQTYDEIEYIVIDGGSTDDTLEKINNHDVNVDLLISEADKGIYDALNKGLKHATGDVIGFLHSDDQFKYPEAIEEVVLTLTNTGKDALYADLEYVSRNDVDKVIRKWISSNYSRAKFRLGWMPPHPTLYLKRKLYNEFGFFNLGYKISSDYESMVRILWGEGVDAAYLPKILISMKVGGESNKSLKNLLLKLKEDIKVLKSYGIFWPLAIVLKNVSKLPQFFKL